jgi:hypothetical protein
MTSAAKLDPEEWRSIFGKDHVREVGFGSDAI